MPFKTGIEDKSFVVIIIRVNWVVGDILLSVIEVKIGGSGIWLPSVIGVSSACLSAIVVELSHMFDGKCILRMHVQGLH